VDEKRFKPEESLAKDDNGLLLDLFALLSERMDSAPSFYGADSKFAAVIGPLPIGLRAMAATHWLDVSMTLDSICWHFRNFGEPVLVALTEAGLRELGLAELADVFREAGAVMMPLATSGAANWDEAIEKAGVEKDVDVLDRRGWDAYGESTKKDDIGSIYGAWVRYAREKPGQVFAE
jgi:phage tail protein X